MVAVIDVWILEIAGQELQDELEEGGKGED